jgi:hypothetical protein
MTEAEREDEVNNASVHKLMTAPPHAKCFQNRQWNTAAKLKYQQYMCRNQCGKTAMRQNAATRKVRQSGDGWKALNKHFPATVAQAPFRRSRKGWTDRT